MSLGGARSPARLVIKDSVFRDNTAHDYQGTYDKGTGGAMLLQDTDALIFSSSFANNTADDDSETQLLSGDDINALQSSRLAICGHSLS